MSASSQPSNRNLAGLVMLISGNTLISRIFGFVRDILFAAIWGTGIAMDALVLAFRIPNLFRNLFGEGALSAALIPSFNRELDEPAAARRLACEVLSVTGKWLTILALLICAASLAAFFLLEPPFYRFTALLLAITIFYTPAICLTALGSGLLNALNHFFLPAALPTLLNLVLIIATWSLTPLLSAPLWQTTIPAVALTLGGLLQFVIIRHQLKSLSYPLHYRPTISPKVKQVFLYSLPAIIGAGVFQLNTLTDSILASWLGEAAVSSLYYSMRLVLLPVGLFGSALGVICLPAMSRAAAQANFKELKGHLHQALGVALFLSLPAAVFLGLHAAELIQLLFQRGAFDSQSTQATVLALVYYLPGIPIFTCAKVITPAYHSRFSNKIPLYISLLCLVVNLILNLIFMQFLRQGGLALATSCSSLLNVVLLLYFLRRDLGLLQLRKTLRHACKMGFALLPLIIFSLSWHLLMAAENQFWQTILKVSCCFIFGLVTYPLICQWLRLPEPALFFARFFKR